MSVVREEETHNDDPVTKVLQFQYRTRVNHWETVFLKVRNSFMYFSYTQDFMNTIFKIDLLKVKVTVGGMGDSTKFVIIVSDKDKYECKARSLKMQKNFVSFIKEKLQNASNYKEQRESLKSSLLT